LCILRGSQLSRSDGEEHPSNFVKRKLDLRGSQQSHRDILLFKGSQPLGGREDSSNTVRKVSWVEKARWDAQKQENSRSMVSSKKGPCHTIGLAFVSKGVANQKYWRGIVVADPMWEADPLPVWETNILPGDGGWNTSLAKREC